MASTNRRGGEMPPNVITLRGSMPIAPDPTVSIDGKTVTFKTRFPVKDNERLGKLIQDAADGSVKKQVALLCWVIDSWEYDGDPHNPRSYDDLDALADILPMMSAFGDYIGERTGLGDRAKN